MMPADDSFPRLRGARPIPKGRPVDPAAVDEVRAFLGGDTPVRDELIEALHAIQDTTRCLSARHIAALAEIMGLAQAEVYEVATFYAHFDVIAEGEAPPPDLTVRVCDGIACALAGADSLARDLPGSLGPGVRVKPAPCVGGCDSAPMAVVGQNRIGSATAESVRTTVETGATTTPVPAYRTLDAYRAGGGYASVEGCRSGGDREGTIAAIEASGLAGLGGAGFPTGRKLRFLDGTPRPRVVAINADEGEPGTFKDRHCLETDPHRVLEGALISAWAVDADDVWIYLRDEYPHIRAILTTEIAALAASGLARDIRLHLRRGAGAYICGEESAMLESLEGKRGLPRNRPPYPAQAGLFGRPTLIQNVETAWWLPEIIGRGAQAFRDAGHPRFYSVSGRVAEPGVKLAPSGVTARQLIDDHAGGLAAGHTFKGYLPGGASGGILPAAEADQPLDFGALDSLGCFVGSAAIVVLSDADALRPVARNLLVFFAEESCGQCTPCRLGCEKMIDLIDAPTWDRPLIEELSQAMADASICGLGQAAPNPVLCALRFFADEVT